MGILTGVAYEGDGFIRALPATAAVPRKAPVRQFEIPARIEEIAVSVVEIEQQAKALRRDYMNAWLRSMFDKDASGR